MSGSRASQTGLQARRLCYNYRKMGMNTQRGFTIIEVTLFLALTGLLAMLLLGGWTTMINTQRYKDSIKTVQSFIQEQYNLVYNVENGRGSDLRCVAGTVTESGGTGEQRGQSDCVMMGRYLHVNGGTRIDVYAIIGDEPANDTTNSDIDSIRAYSPQLSTLSLGLTRNELNIPWQARVVGPGGSVDARNLAIAIIRTPSSGIVHTYAATAPSDGSRPTVASLVSTANEQSTTLMCLDAGNPLAGGRMGVMIQPRASSQTFVETIDEGAGVC